MIMNRLAILSLIFSFVAVVSTGFVSTSSSRIRVKRQVTVPSELSKIDIDKYFKNKPAVKFQLKCLLDNGQCDKIGKDLKKFLPELLTHLCEKCDRIQRENAGKLLRNIQKDYPADWERSVKKFHDGPVKPEDAAKLESNLGVRLEQRFIAQTTTSEEVTRPGRFTTTTTTSPEEEPISSTYVPAPEWPEYFSSESPESSSFEHGSTIASEDSISSSSSLPSENSLLVIFLCFTAIAKVLCV